LTSFCGTLKLAVGKRHFSKLFQNVNRCNRVPEPVLNSCMKTVQKTNKLKL